MARITVFLIDTDDPVLVRSLAQLAASGQLATPAPDAEPTPPRPVRAAPGRGLINFGSIRAALEGENEFGLARNEIARKIGWTRWSTSYTPLLEKMMEDGDVEELPGRRYRLLSIPDDEPVVEAGGEENAPHPDHSAVPSEPQERSNGNGRMTREKVIAALTGAKYGRTKTAIAKACGIAGWSPTYGPIISAMTEDGSIKAIESFGKIRYVLPDEYARGST